MNDPGFGNKFVRAFASQRRAMPPAVYEAYLRRAYNYYAGTNLIEDMVMVEILQLLCPESRFKKAVLEALLLCQDATISQIAEWVSLSAEVVQVYEQLHFNVRDRMAEKAYIASLAFPRGRLQMLTPDAVDHLSFAQELLQAGYTYGAKEVLVLAGMDSSTELPSREQSMEEFEQSIIANARLLVRTGRQNSTKSPGIDHAKQLISIRRDAIPQATGFDDWKHGLGSLGMTPGDAINQTIDGIMADASPDGGIITAEEDEVIRAQMFAQRQSRSQSGEGPLNRANCTITPIMER